jgi:hypothetical protein
MQIEKSFVWEMLNESWFDITEEFEELLSEWCDDLSVVIPDDDIDFNDTVRSITRGYKYWRFNPDQMTSYERLRTRYDALLEAHIQLINDHQELRAESSRLAWPCRKRARKKVYSSINRGCGSAAERRFAQNVNPDAA